MIKKIVKKTGIGKAILKCRLYIKYRYFDNNRYYKIYNKYIAKKEAISIENRICSSSLYFNALKNKYSGRRGFVIGNGPSLKLSDLELLQGEITIAANKIYLAFDKINWRPSFLTIVDPLVWSKVQDQIWKHHDLIHTPSYLPKGKKPSKVKTFRYLGNASDQWREKKISCFSDDLSIGAFGGYTVTYENLQMAVHLGLNPIYIIGCDHFYKGEMKSSPNDPIKTIHENNHFLPGYRTAGELVNPATIDEMNESFMQAKIICEKKGIQIINATRGGHLEVFERSRFDDLF